MPNRAISKNKDKTGEQLNKLSGVELVEGQCNNQLD